MLHNPLLLSIYLVLYCIYYFFQAEPPVYWSVREWCDGFKKLLDYLELDKVHLFGASLGNCIPIL